LELPHRRAARRLFAVTEYRRVFAAMGKGHTDAVLASDQVEHTTYGS
jgi:hypothetical protein